MGNTKVNLYKIPPFPEQTERIEAMLKTLKLEGSIACYKNTISKYSQKKFTLYDFLESLLNSEFAYQEGKRITRWTQNAKFTEMKSLDDFKFFYNRTIDEHKIRELASSRFIKNQENVIFLGPPGVGKTHLAIALGIEAIHNGFETRFIELKQIIELFDKANNSADYIRRFSANLIRPDLLIIDEVDLFEVSPAIATFLSKIFLARYEKAPRLLLQINTLMNGSQSSEIKVEQP